MELDDPEDLSNSETKNKQTKTDFHIPLSTSYLIQSPSEKEPKPFEQWWNFFLKV